MMTKSTLVAGAMALALGILQSTSVVAGHGHGGGHGGHGGHGHHHHHGHYNDGFWSGGGMVGYGAENGSDDPCNDPKYREIYPGKCIN